MDQRVQIETSNIWLDTFVNFKLIVIDAASHNVTNESSSIVNHHLKEFLVNL